MLQLIIEVAVDVNTHVAAESGRVPDDNYHSFVLASEAGLISAALALRLAPSTGLRNRLVHGYEALDDELVYEAAKASLRDYPVYLREVLSFLERPESGE